MPQSIQLWNPAPTPRADSFPNFIDEFITHHLKGLSPKTVWKYRMSLERFEIFANRRPVDRQLILDYMAHLDKKGFSPSYYNRHLMELAAFLKWCELHELIDGSPYKFISYRPVPQQPMPPIFTEEEYERIKDATKGTPYYYMVVLGYRAGMSMIDACFLRWENVDLENLMIVSSRLKMARRCRSAIYRIPIIAGGDLHLLLQDMLENRVARCGNDNDNYVNPFMAGFYRYNSVCDQPGTKHTTMYFISLFKKLGIHGKSFKHFRSTFISHLANAGGNIVLACQITGHSDPAIFMSYVKPDPKALRDMVMKAQAWAENQKEKK